MSQRHCLLLEIPHVQKWEVSTQRQSKRLEMQGRWLDGYVKLWLVSMEGKDTLSVLYDKMLDPGNEASRRTRLLGLQELMPGWLCGQPRESADNLKATTVADAVPGPIWAHPTPAKHPKGSCSPHSSSSPTK